MKKEPGGISQILAAMLCTLALTVLMFSFLSSVRLLRQKSEVSGIARKYILRMETVGWLNGDDRARLLLELEDAGVREADLSGSTLWETTYGAPIVLEIRGRLEGGYEFVERRASTAKN